MDTAPKLQFPVLSTALSTHVESLTCQTQALAAISLLVERVCGENAPVECGKVLRWDVGTVETGIMQICDAHESGKDGKGDSQICSPIADER